MGHQKSYISDLHIKNMNDEWGNTLNSPIYQTSITAESLMLAFSPQNT